MGGCYTTPPVTTYVDPVNGLRTDLLGENLLDTKEPAREMVWLNASRMFKNRTDFSYYLEVHYMANVETGPLNVYPGQTLTIIADGEELKFGGIGSTNARKEKNSVISEDAVYEAKESDMQKIARAKKVIVKIAGKNSLVVREFSPANSERFQKFLEQTTQPPPQQFPTH